jgi:hypothetical protein
MADAELIELVAGEVTQSPRRRPALATVEYILGMLVEIPAALLVVAEIVILFAGVVARYGLHSPLIWSDELSVFSAPGTPRRHPKNPVARFKKLVNTSAFPLLNHPLTSYITR